MPTKDGITLKKKKKKKRFKREGTGTLEMASGLRRIKLIKA